MVKAKEKAYDELNKKQRDRAGNVLQVGVREDADGKVLTRTVC